MTQPRQREAPGAGRQALEMLLFLGVSVLGILGLGNGLGGVFEPGGSLNPGWLVVTGVAIWFLFTQMGRVHDRWPHLSRSEPTTAARRGSGAAEPIASTPRDR